MRLAAANSSSALKTPAEQVPACIPNVSAARSESPSREKPEAYLRIRSTNSGWPRQSS